MRLLDRSFHAFDEADALKAQAYAIAPWLAGDAVAERRPSEERPRDGGRT